MRSLDTPERQIKMLSTRLKNVNEEMRVLRAENERLRRGEPVDSPHVWRPIVTAQSLERAVELLHEALEENARGKKFVLSKHEGRAIQMILAALGKPFSR